MNGVRPLQHGDTYYSAELPGYTGRTFMTVVAPSQTQTVRFSMFDWLDESGRGQGETYAERLRMLELADNAGFYAYHLAEHHATELSTVPSPNLFLSAVAQRTRGIRMGPLSYVLP